MASLEALICRQIKEISHILFAKGVLTQSQIFKNSQPERQFTGPYKNERISLQNDMGCIGFLKTPAKDVPSHERYINNNHFCNDLTF